MLSISFNVKTHASRSTFPLASNASSMGFCLIYSFFLNQREDIGCVQIFHCLRNKQEIKIADVILLIFKTVHIIVGISSLE